MRKIILLYLCLASSLPAAAQEGPIPHLGEHVFVPAMAITEPFITTHVQSTVGLGNTVNARVPIIDITDDGIIGFIEADIALAVISFKYQHAVKDWLAVHVDLGSSGRLGTSTPSLVAEGITGIVGYEMGWILRAHQSRKVLVSCSVGLGNKGATFINLLNWAEGIIGGQEVSLVRAKQSLQGVGGLHAAWGVSRRFGLLGSFKVKYGEAFDGRAGNRWMPDIRLALSYDLDHDLKVPLGLALTGGHYGNNEGTQTESGIWFWSCRLAVQTRKDFTIGLDVARHYVKSLKYGNSQELSQISIDMRYFY